MFLFYYQMLKLVFYLVNSSVQNWSYLLRIRILKSKQTALGLGQRIHVLKIIKVLA